MIDQAKTIEAIEARTGRTLTCPFCGCQDWLVAPKPILMRTTIQLDADSEVVESVLVICDGCSRMDFYHYDMLLDTLADGPEPDDGEPDPARFIRETVQEAVKEAARAPDPPLHEMLADDGPTELDEPIEDEEEEEDPPPPPAEPKKRKKKKAPPRAKFPPEKPVRDSVDPATYGDASAIALDQVREARKRMEEEEGNLYEKLPAAGLFNDE